MGSRKHVRHRKQKRAMARTVLRALYDALEGVYWSKLNMLTSYGYRVDFWLVVSELVVDGVLVTVDEDGQRTPSFRRGTGSCAYRLSFDGFVELSTEGGLESIISRLF